MNMWGWVKRPRIWWGAVLLLTIVGFWMRFPVILKTYSFWNDEAHVALIAKSLLLRNKVFYFRGFFPTGLYQLFTYYLTAVSMGIFGMNEFGARVAYVLIGTLIIPLVAWIGWRLSGKKKAGLLAAFLIAFSNLEIAWSEQVRPYIVLQFLFLVLIWIWIKYIEGRLGEYKWITLTLFLSIILMLYHTSAFVVGIIYLGVIIYVVTKRKSQLPASYYLVLGGLAFLILTLILKLGVLNYILTFVSNLNLERIKFKIWHFWFFWKHYLLYLLLGLGGLGSLKKKWWGIILFIIIVTIILHLAVILRPSGSVYVRYTLITFPFIYIGTAVGIKWLEDKIKMGWVGGLIILLLVVGLGVQNKTLNFCYNCYHSINADVRENPLADYKRFFHKAKPYFDKYPQAALIDAWEDRDVWYLNRKVDGFMINRSDHRGKKTTLGGVFITNVDELKAFLKKTGQAMVVVEGWPSLAGNKMQDFIRHNLKFEYKVCDEKLANEGWCLELYSYGVKNGKN